jgi:hypothetical protein
MTKITAEHLARSAYVYIRQFTPGQFVHNHESRHRQYALADHRAGVPEHVGRDALLSRPGCCRAAVAACCLSR